MILFSSFLKFTSQKGEGDRFSLPFRGGLVRREAGCKLCFATGLSTWQPEIECIQSNMASHL